VNHASGLLVDLDNSDEAGQEGGIVFLGGQ